MLDVVPRSSVLVISDNFDTLCDGNVKLINEHLKKKDLQFPVLISESYFAPYGPVQREVVRRVRDAGWMITYNIEKRSFLIS